MPPKDKTQTNRDRKKNKKINSDINGKYNSKYVRQKEAIVDKKKKETISNESNKEERI